VIDGQLQRASGSGKLIQFSPDSQFPHSVIDLSSLYKGQSESTMRGIGLLASDEVLIQDELSGLKPGSRVRWGMITAAETDVIGGSSIQLRGKEASLELAILAPSSSAWRLIDTARPRNPWDSPNVGTRMVAFEAVAPQSGRLTLAVLATPGSCLDSQRKTLQVRPLEVWSKPSGR
jgi:hypothetical protein